MKNFWSRVCAWPFDVLEIASTSLFWESFSHLLLGVKNQILLIVRNFWHDVLHKFAPTNLKNVSV